MTGSGGHAIDGYETVEMPGRAVPERATTTMLRRRSAQPSRRAVLHVRAAGDPAVPAGLAAWYTERAFHFYLAGLRLPGQPPVGARPGARYLAAAYADMDAACEHLRQADGIASVIVSAQGRSAIAAALWSDARAAAADALILQAPQLPAWAGLSLNIGCPVLVVADPAGETAPRQRRWPVALRRVAADRTRPQLGSHVTWLRLPPDACRGAADPAGLDGQQEHRESELDQRGFFDELGRWLGAYMYGQGRDRLL